MANHLVSGQVVPDSVANHVALELCNTRTGWGSPTPREYLVSYDALAVWAGDVGLLTTGEVRALRAEARSHPRLAAREVARAVALRESWYPVATAAWLERPLPPADLDVLAAYVAEAMAVSDLVPDGSGRVRASGGSVASAGLALPVNRAALEAYDLLASGGVVHVGRCSGHGCGWTFFDPSHRRHWCIMALCGNRAKARAFAARRRGETAGPVPRRAHG